MRILSPLLLVLALLLSACAGLPMDSAPRAGVPVLGAQEQEVQSQPDPPRDGARPEEIWRGFLLANGSSTDSYEVARAYLSPGLADTWNPTSNVLIRSGDAQVSQANSVDSGQIESSVSVDAVLNQEGTLTEFDEDEVRTEDFELSEVEGQWRITALPEDFGLWLSRTEFDRQFQTAEISYVSDTEDVFVSDIRWFPRDGGTTTALARALLEPTPAYLEGAVRTGVLEGMDLADGSVPIDVATSTATVNLRGPGLSEDEDRIRMLWAQLVQTLTQVGGVDSVRLELNGQPVELADIDPSVASPRDLGYQNVVSTDSYGLVRSGTELLLVDPDDHALAELDPAEEGVETPANVSRIWQNLAVNQSLSIVAGTDEERESLWLRNLGGATEFDNVGTDLTNPQLTDDGTLWVGAQRGSMPAIWVFDSAGTQDQIPIRIEAEWLEAGTELHQLSVAPDGQRVAVVTHQTDSGPDQIGVAGILRDAEGDAVALAPLQRKFALFDSVEAVSWATDDALMVLGQRDEEQDPQPRPFVATLNSWVSPLGEAPQAETVRGFLTPDELLQNFVVTSESTILTREGAGWQSYRDGDDLLVPGQ